MLICGTKCRSVFPFHRTEFYLHLLTDLPVSPKCWFLIFPTASFLEYVLSNNIHITQPCSCSHAFWKEDWPWGINRTPWGGNPVHMRQDRESSIPLPPFKHSQNLQGTSHRDRTGWDGTGQYCWASGELHRCTRTSSSWFPHSGSPSGGMGTAM